MPYPHAEELAPHEFVVRLETNKLVSPGSFGTVLREIDRLAHLRSQFGSEAEVYVVDLGTGSAWARIGIGLAVAANIAGIGGFLMLVEERIHRPTGTLSEAIATMALDDSVVEAKIVTHERTISIAANKLPAIETVQRRRLRAAADPVALRRHYSYVPRPIDPDPRPVRQRDDYVALPIVGKVGDDGWIEALPRAPDNDEDDVQSAVPRISMEELNEGIRGELPSEGMLLELKYLMGELYPADPGGEMQFVTARGRRFEAIVNEGAQRDDYPFGKQVMVLAQETTRANPARDPQLLISQIIEPSDG